MLISFSTYLEFDASKSEQHKNMKPICNWTGGRDHPGQVASASGGIAFPRKKGGLYCSVSLIKMTDTHCRTWQTWNKRKVHQDFICFHLWMTKVDEQMESWLIKFYIEMRSYGLQSQHYESCKATELYKRTRIHVFLKCIISTSLWKLPVTCLFYT